MGKDLSLSLYVCNLCKLKFQSSKMRYSQDGKNLICIHCHNKLKGGKQETPGKSTAASAAGTTKAPLPGSIHVICAHCNYKFFYRPELKPVCPYCGKNKLRSYDKVTAQNLIDEDSRMI